IGAFQLPSAFTESLWTMPAEPHWNDAICVRKSGRAWFSLKTTVIGSAASTLSTFRLCEPSNSDRHSHFVLGSRYRFQVQTTSALVSAAPLWNLTPGRSLKG